MAPKRTLTNPARNTSPEGGWPAAAWSFHNATRNTRWATPAQAAQLDRLTAEQARHEPPPPPYKEPVGRGIKFDLASPTGEFAKVLRSRRTHRGFGSQPVSKADLGRLLTLTFGATMVGATGAGEQRLFKTSPSAGALHPTEAYVLALNVAGVPRGLYYFSPKTSRLHVLRRGASRRQLLTYLSGQWWYGDAAALVLLTSRVPRVWRRYPSGRAYRSLLLDAGHVCQTFCLVATWLKLATFSTQALADSLIERDLGIDGREEVLLYSAGIGSLPKGGAWVQWPDHQPDDPYRPRTRVSRADKSRQ